MRNENEEKAEASNVITTICPIVGGSADIEYPKHSIETGHGITN